jgi:hypothetical protein
MARRLWPLLALLLIAACGDDPSGPDQPALQTVTIESWDYLDNRFFRLDLPPVDVDGDGQHDPVLGYTRPDVPGRSAGERIDRSSIRIYRFVGGGMPQPMDVQNIAVAVDTTGRWDESGWITNQPLTAWTAGLIWRPVEFDLYVSDTNVLIAVDLHEEMFEFDLLAVVYAVVDQDGDVVYQVGEDPNFMPPGLDLNGDLYYRMKLLKAHYREAFTFQYVLRNFYSLGATSIDFASFSLRIERNLDDAHADLHYAGDAPGDDAVDYLRVFGLDNQNAQGQAGADGEVDKYDTNRFDLTRGLLKFPREFPFPFAADSLQYATNAGVDIAGFPWDDTFLAANRTPEIYRSTTAPSQYAAYGKFRLVATMGPPVTSGRE